MGNRTAIAEWTESLDSVLADAVKAIEEDLAAGASFEESLEHYAYLFAIELETLRHEWNLRKEDTR